MYKVLLVDDEPIITQGLQALLNWEDYGFEVVYIAQDGEEALAYMKENTIHLLVTDIMMPKMTGLQLIEESQKIQSHIKYIILSGYQEFDYVKQGMRLGIENYLLKPVDEEELIKTVQAVSQKLYTSLNRAHDPEFTTLKDNTLWRLLNGEIEKSDWQERLSLYEMSFIQSFYNVSILHFTNDRDMKKSKQLRRYIEENYSATCLYNPDQELIIIFEAEREDILVEYNKKLTWYLEKAYAEIGNFFLSMGKAVTSIEDLEDSYILARELSLYQICLEANMLISDKINIDKQQLLRVQQEYKVEVAKRVLKSEEEIAKGIKQFFGALHVGESYVSHIVVRKYTIDLISYIHHSVQIDKYYNHTSAIEKLVYASNIEQIQEVLQDYCDELIHTIDNQNDTRSPIVQNVLEYMHANYNQELSLKTLSQRFHVNPIYLGQLFQKELGVVFSEYINHYRLEKAKELLKSTHLRAGEIGKQVGYSDTTYFYKQFKKNVGATPTEWRNI
ncbi:response regulator transcription factor [Lederbergia lenta]|uniref:Two-component sensor response regulator n=1 Tax=Lederbergia lenta TaxID=1467 RepID=A0A2X4WGV3_LEDLE|nr:response regulator transcription factor [Lederbergia lenta]MCM3111780.1 response regulator transcription factor [Lederbergia lenta]MEC2322934.1 response regulator transcription factor [Lederbergia lenta]SQI62069.1 two-component sensor response regulator [Lederbergia lenta]